jgi:amidase
MKSNYTRSLLVIMALILCLITCKTPVNNTVHRVSDNNWIEELTISQLQKGYSEGKYSVKDIVKVYLERIQELDKNGPRLNSIIEINPDALLIAEQMDKEKASGKIPGALFGVPVILKDNIDTHDKMPTTAGATALRNSFPASDSYVAKKLREAGAVIIAKSNLSEWANFRARMSSSGWSGVGRPDKKSLCSRS